MGETATEHKHYFSAIPCRLGPYGPQDVHYHSCIEGEPGDCYEVIMGAGADCGGKDSSHEHMTLTEDGPQPGEALARLRPPVAADPGQPSPRVYSFTRDQLIAALLRLGYRRFVPAEPMADAIIGALDATEQQRAFRAGVRADAAGVGKSAATEEDWPDRGTAENAP